MKGYLYYPALESERNRLFIDDLMKEAKGLNIDLQLLLSKSLPNDATFVLFRARDPQLASKWERTGIRLFNHAAVNEIANDKLKTYNLATELEIPTIPTQLVTDLTSIQTYPIVIKTVDGHGGQEVFLCQSPQEATQVFDLFQGRSLIVQPYIESNAQDVRVFMLGQKVLGAVKRTGLDSFKSNYTLGGSIEPYQLANWQLQQVQRIAKTIHSDYIGIDFLLLPDGRWLLNEIEDPVGARSLYSMSQIPVAKHVMTYIKQQIHF